MSAQRLAEQTAAARSAGLTPAEVARRLAADGPNEVPSARPTPLPARVGRQLADPLILLLLAAAVVTSVLADYPDTMVIALVVVVNTAIGVVQEVRADRAVAALNRLAAPTARVVRDESEQVIVAAGLIRGDLVSIQAGDVVPADLQLVTAVQLTIDEAAVTGESVPVDRAGETRRPPAPSWSPAARPSLSPVPAPTVNWGGSPPA